MVERKVSDIIISLESDVKTLISATKHNDFQLKLILKLLKSNLQEQNAAVLAQPRDQIAEKKAINTITQAKPIIPGLKPGVVMGPNGLQNKISDEDNYEFPEVNTISNKPIELLENINQEEIVGKRRTNRYNNDGNIVGRAVPVKQKILYPDGKLCCLASVEIFDIEHESETIIQKVRTNAMGEWNASLRPGQYHVNILKPKALNKPEVRFAFNISIPSDSGGPLELPSPEN